MSLTASNQAGYLPVPARRRAAPRRNTRRRRLAVFIPVSFRHILSLSLSGFSFRCHPQTTDFQLKKRKKRKETQNPKPKKNKQKNSWDLDLESPILHGLSLPRRCVREKKKFQKKKNTNRWKSISEAGKSVAKRPLKNTPKARAKKK